MEVVDFLHVAGERYKEHVRMLRAQRDSHEMDDFTGKPTISPFAVEYNLARDRFQKASGSIVAVQDRLHNLHKRKLERAEAARTRAQTERSAKEMEELTLKPDISHKAKSMPARGSQADVTAKWLDEHNKRLQRLHEEALVREMSNVQPGPIVAPYSSELARLRHADPNNSSRFDEDMKQRRAAGNIADYLLAKEEERQIRLKMKAAETELGDGNSFHPQISRRARSTRSSLDVTERLVQDAEQKRSGQSQDSHYDDNCTFVPQVSEASRRIVDRMREGEPVKSTSRQPNDHSYSFRPEISSVSRKLAEQRKHRTDLDVSSVKKSSRASSITTSDQTPIRISEKSRALAEDHYAKLRSTIKGGDRMSNDELRMFAARRASQRQNAAAARQREMEEAAELAECTFQPQLSSRHHVNASIVVTDEDAERFYERNMLWTNRRDRTLQQQRQQESTKEVEECSFHPRIHDQVPLPAAARDGGSAISTLAPGASSYIKRMNAARDMKRENERRVNGKPKISRPACGFTTPAPFRLGREREEGLNSTTIPKDRQWSEYRTRQREAADSVFDSQQFPQRPPTQRTPVDFVLGNHNRIAKVLHASSTFV